jgi:NADP-dependent 3-hydroxy acid dehydrogenase YdfG
VLDTGDAVVATARRPEQLADLATTYGERILALPLDVTDAAAAAVSIAVARERFGRPSRPENKTVGAGGPE